LDDEQAIGIAVAATNPRNVQAFIVRNRPFAGAWLWLLQELDHLPAH
jgi:hypothetical protein